MTAGPKDRAGLTAEGAQSVKNSTMVVQLQSPNALPAERPYEWLPGQAFVLNVRRHPEEEMMDIKNYSLDVPVHSVATM